MSSNDNAPLLEPLRFSRLKLMAKSAAHYAANVAEETAPIRKGSALHSYLLGDKDCVAVYPKARNKKHKAYQEFLEQHPAQTILSPRELVDVDGMRNALLAHDRARELLDGVREQKITWDIGGRECSGTPDVVHLYDRNKVLVELKTGQSSAPSLFRWQGKKLSYPVQVAWYADGLEKTMLYKPGPVTAIYVVAVESSPPYPVTVFAVTEQLRLQARKQYRLWLEQLRNCEHTGIFPAYAAGDVEWDVEEAELEWDDAAA